MCLYACIYLYLYVYVHIYIHTHEYKCIYVCKYIYIHTCKFTGDTFTTHTLSLAADARNTASNPSSPASFNPHSSPPTADPPTPTADDTRSKQSTRIWPVAHVALLTPAPVCASSSGLVACAGREQVATASTTCLSRTPPTSPPLCLLASSCCVTVCGVSSDDAWVALSFAVGWLAAHTRALCVSSSDGSVVCVCACVLAAVVLDLAEESTSSSSPTPLTPDSDAYTQSVKIHVIQLVRIPVI